MIWFCVLIDLIAAILIAIAGFYESKEIDRAADKPGGGNYRLGRVAILPVSLAIVGVALTAMKVAGWTFAVEDTAIPLIGVGLVGAGAVLGLLILGVHYCISLRRRHARPAWRCALLDIIALLLCLICYNMAA